MKKVFARIAHGLSIILIAYCGVLSVAVADNVAMVETSKFLAPETVNLLTQRAANGGPYGLQVGDTIKYIIKYKPVPNGGNTGANGYVTDYIPAGLQVIDAGFVQPDGAGGYFKVPPVPAGDMSNDPGGNGKRNFVSPTPLLPATPVNTGGLGTLAQVYGDVGVWYSIDPRTALNPLAPPGTSRNQWDLNELAVCDAFKGANAPWGTCSPVSGPESFYQNELQAPSNGVLIGPWRRIAVAGSRIGTYGLMGDIQASRELLLGDPQYGRDLSTNPIPVSTLATPVTIRWANGLNSVGQVKYASVTAKIISLPPNGAIINESEVWGGDVFYGEGGKDNAWKYNTTLVSVANNSSMVVFKQPSVETAQPGDVVSFQVTIINTGARQHNNVVVTDYLNTSQRPGKPGKFELMSQYNFDASAGGLYTAGPIGNTPGSENITWTLPVLNPGASQTFTYSVTALTPPNRKVQDASDTVVVTSNQLPITGTQSSASYTIGTFPLLNQSKTVIPSSVLPGGTVRYHIQMMNSGAGYAGTYHTVPFPGVTYYPVDATLTPMSTVIEDTLPTGFSYVGNPVLTINGAPVLGSTLSALGNVITWHIPHTVATPNELPPGAVLDLFFDAQANAGLAAGIYTNTVYSEVPYNKKPKNKAPKVKLGKSDWALKPLWSINTAPVSVGTVQLSKVTTVPTVVNTPTGTATNYTITLTNNGAVAANGIAVTDTLPAGFSYKVGSTSGTAGVGEPTVIGQDIIWPTFNVPAASSRTLIFTANIAASVLPSVFRNDVRATAVNATIPDALQTAPVTVTLPGLSINKTVDRSAVPWRGAGVVAAPLPTETVSYTITLTNSGSGYATVNVSDQLPAGFEFDPLIGIESVTLNVNGIATVLNRGVTDTATTYATFPQAPIVLPTRTPQWGTFTIPPAQGGTNSILTITFPVKISMAQTPPVGVLAVTAPGVFDNQVTVSGNTNVPVFMGAPVKVYQPATKSTTTPNVAVNGLIDYRLTVDNADAVVWTGVSVTDYLGALTTAGIAPAVASGAVFSAGSAYYAIGLSPPAGVPGTDPLWLPTVPVVVASDVTFDNAGGGFSIPVGQKLFIAFKATAPAVVPVPAVIHNSIRTLAYTANAVVTSLTSVYDGGLLANTTEDVTITATPSVTLSASKTVTPSSLYLYGAAAPNALTYTVTLSNTDLVTAATGIIINDVLPPNISFGVGDVANVSINGGAPVPLTPVWTPPAIAGGSGTLSISLGANAIPATGTAVVTFTASVAALTPANTYFNSATWAGTNVNAGSVGPTAPVIIDPVSVTKQTLTPSVVAGGVVNYRITVKNSGNQPLNTFSITDYLGDLTPLLPSGFTFASDVSVSLNGSALTAGVDYMAPAVGSAAPVWNFITPIPAATPGSAATIVIDFAGSVPPASPAGLYNNSISLMTFSPGILAAVNVANPYDGAIPANTADDVSVSTVGINKSVVQPFGSVVKDPLLGATTQYELLVSNVSAAPQTVTLQDSLPAGFSLKLGTAYFALGAVSPTVAPPAAPWVLTTANIGAPQTINTPLFDNGGAGFIVPANQNLYIRFVADIAPSVLPGTYNNTADVRLTGVPVGSVTAAPVTVQAPQLFLSKITTTPNVGKDGLGNYGLAHYRISISNTGNVSGTGVVLNDILPAGFTLVPTSVVITNDGIILPPASYAANQVGQTVSFDTVPAAGFNISAAIGGNNGQLNIEYDTSILGATPAGIAVNSVSASSTNAGALGPIGASVTLNDLGLSKTTATPNVTPGTTASYTITVNNFGATPVANVVVTDFLPSGFTYVALSTTGTGWVAAEPILTSGQPVWTIANLAAASTATISFNVDVDTLVAAGVYYNSVTATSGALVFPATGPTAPINAQLSVPSLTVLKSADVTAATPGQVITYTIQVVNTGSGAATNVRLNDVMSPYVNLGINSYGAGLPFLYVEGTPPSALTIGVLTYKDRNGVAYPALVSGSAGASAGFDGDAGQWQVPMVGSMPPSATFSLQYKVEVR